jgi:glutamate formiminotransferase
MKQADWAPDFGPAAPHPSAGASVIGARMPLIAYNINLATDRLDVAKKIATAVRHSSGGLRFVKAMGVPLADRGIVQVSMNLTNYEKTPIPSCLRARQTRGRALWRVGSGKRDRRARPAAALTASAAWFLQVDSFTDDLVLETRLRKA